MPRASLRREPPKQHFTLIVLGGAAGLVIAALILRFVLGIDIFRQGSTDKQPVAQQPQRSSANRTQKRQQIKYPGDKPRPIAEDGATPPGHTSAKTDLTEPRKENAASSQPSRADPRLASDLENSQIFDSVLSQNPPANDTDSVTPTGLFGPTGDRFEVLEIPGQPRDAVRARCKSIADWGTQAVSSQSDEFRTAACHALINIVFNNAQKVHELTKSEVGGCRDVALKMLRSSDISVRRCAVRMLTSVRDDGCLRDLIAASRDKDAEVRQGACEAMGWFGNEAAIDTLNSIAKRDPSTIVVEACVRSLATIKTGRAKTALRELYRRANTPASKDFILAAIDSIEN